MEPVEREILHYVCEGVDLFDAWLQGLADMAAHTAIVRRIERVRRGNFGDHRSVGGGVKELRIDSGPGYRLYYGEDGPRVVLLLCGGDKSSQSKDIRRAIGLWDEYRRGR